MPDLRFAFVTLDCQDLDAVGAFWAALLEASLGDPMDDGRFVFLRDRDDIPTFCLQRVTEAKATKNRMHLDIHVAAIEPEAARLEALGARRVDGTVNHEHGSSWILMQDPEGNEFCVCDGAAPAEDASGHE